MEEKNINNNSEEIVTETNKEVDEVSTTNIEEKENNNNNNNNNEVVIADKKVKLVREVENLDNELSKQVSVKTDTITNLDDIENERIAFFNEFNKRRRNSNILTAVALVCIIVSIFFLVNDNSVLKLIGWIIIGLLIVEMILHYALVKRKNPQLTKDYIEKINKMNNGYVFGLTELKDTVSDSLERLELSEAIADKVYLDLIRIGSRNLVYGAYKNGHFRVADLSLYARGEKQQVTAFVGKYITFPNTIKFNGRIIINVSSDTPTDLPTDVLDLVKTDLSSEFKNMTIYCSEGVNYKEIIKDKFLDKLAKIEIKDHLLNINLVIWGGHSAVYLSYDDSVIALPFDKEFDKTSISQYRDNLVSVLSLLADINK